MPKLEPLDISFCKTLETTAVLRATTEAESVLGRLKGIVQSMPNNQVLLCMLDLQEAKTSSEIENITTTNDDVSRIFAYDRAMRNSDEEMTGCAAGLRIGYDAVNKDKALYLSTLLKVQKCLIVNTAGLRTQPGAIICNLTRETYILPKNAKEIEILMTNLIDFIKDPNTGINHLVKMAIIHHQFESIHPFCDGNGRTGRILNVLYLVLVGKLEMPTLPLSRYIMVNKSEYYRLLQLVRDDNNTADAWQKWLLYMIKGITKASHAHIAIIDKIKTLRKNLKQSIRRDHPSIYSKDLINALFEYPLTTIESMQKDLGRDRQTVTMHLDILVADGHLQKQKIGRNNFYINDPLLNCLTEIHN